MDHPATEPTDRPGCDEVGVVRDEKKDDAYTEGTATLPSTYGSSCIHGSTTTESKMQTEEMETPQVPETPQSALGPANVECNTYSNGIAHPYSSDEKDSTKGLNLNLGRSARRHRPKHFDSYIDSSVMMSTQDFEMEEDVEAEIDCVANLLSSVDKEGCSKALICDADKILHETILPLSYPWHHKIDSSLKAMPCDIDEMPDIIKSNEDTHDVFSKGYFGYGKFEVGKTMKGVLSGERTGQSAARRCDDIGKIELTTIEPIKRRNKPSSRSDKFDLSPRKSSKEKLSAVNTNKKRKFSNLYEGEDSTDKTIKDITFEFYKHKESESDEARTKDLKRISKKFISVRFGSVSSRSSIFPTFLESDSVAGEETRTRRVPLLVPALLPLEVQQGRSLVVPTALKNATALGSYDIRHGSDSYDGKGKRLPTGRVRKLWTKYHFEPPSYRRITFSSLLTSERLHEAVDYKRPREIVLGIRLNGVLVSRERPEALVSEKCEFLEGEIDDPVCTLAGLSERATSVAISTALGTSKNRKVAIIKPAVPLTRFQKGEPMCLFDSQKFLSELFEEKKSEKKDCDRNENDIVHLGFNEPTFECLPVSDGPIRVICTQPGTLQPQWLSSIISQKGHQRSLCSVCWSKTSMEKLDTCSKCEVKVHRRCCASQGHDDEKDGTWQCGFCAVKSIATKTMMPLSSAPKRRKTKAPLRFRTDDENKSKGEAELAVAAAAKCRLCPHSGGAMSPAISAPGLAGGYIHEVCRVWTIHSTKSKATKSRRDQQLSRNLLLSKMREVCAVCGTTVLSSRNESVSELVKCAATGCNVHFHPMCALLSTKITEEKFHENDKLMSQGKEDRKKDELEDLRLKDLRLCKEYTLSMVRCTLPSNRRNQRRGFEATIPVAFCCFHNPKRDASLYGCYPCRSPTMKIFTGAMSIPPKKKA